MEGGALGCFLGLVMRCHGLPVLFLPVAFEAKPRYVQWLRVVVVVCLHLECRSAHFARKFLDSPISKGVTHCGTSLILVRVALVMDPVLLDNVCVSSWILVSLALISRVLFAPSSVVGLHCQLHAFLACRLADFALPSLIERLRIFRCAALGASLQKGNSSSPSPA